MKFLLFTALAAMLATAYGIGLNSYLTSPVVYGNGWGMNYGLSNMGYSRLAMPSVYSRGLIGSGISSYGMPMNYGYGIGLGRTSLNFI